MTTIAVWTLHGSSLSLLRRISRNFAPALHSWTWSWLLLKHLMSSTSWLGTQKRQKLFRRMQMEAAWSSLMSFANGRLPRSCRLQYYTPDTCITASNFRTYHVSRIYHNANRNGEKKREEPKERNKITRYYKYILNIFWIYFEYCEYPLILCWRGLLWRHRGLWNDSLKGPAEDRRGRRAVNDRIGPSCKRPLTKGVVGIGSEFEWIHIEFTVT